MQTTLRTCSTEGNTTVRIKYPLPVLGVAADVYLSTTVYSAARLSCSVANVDRGAGSKFEIEIEIG
jgi:hypothetical protein